MKASALKSAVAAALCAAGCVSFAQSSNDTNSSGSLSNQSSTYPQDVNGTSRGMDGTNSSGTRSAYDQSRSRSCSGLSDRQTERACREGFSTQHANQPFSSSTREGGGQTDDQAD